MNRTRYYFSADEGEGRWNGYHTLPTQALVDRLMHNFTNSTLVITPYLSGNLVVDTEVAVRGTGRSGQQERPKMLVSLELNKPVWRVPIYMGCNGDQHVLASTYMTDVCGGCKDRSTVLLCFGQVMVEADDVPRIRNYSIIGSPIMFVETIQYCSNAHLRRATVT